MAAYPDIDALDQLAESMATETPGDGDAAIPPILTYFGQFIDHDITANTDREVVGLSEIAGDIHPMDRGTVEAGLGTGDAGGGLDQRDELGRTRATTGDCHVTHRDTLQRP